MNTLTFSKTWRNQLLLKSIFWGVAIVLGIVQIWRNRYDVWADGVPYLDIADAYLKADWSSAINACWSPLYSWILGISLFAIKPSPYWELPVVKLVNFILYLLTLASFNFFLDQIIIYSSVATQRQDLLNKFLKKPDWVWISLGYTIFIWSSIEWVNVSRDTPDMMVAGFIYLASAMVLKIAINPVGWSNYLILGILLGLGYLAKSFMLVLGFIFLVSSVHVGNNLNLKKSLFKLSIAALLMLVIASPFVIALSVQKGRPTFGDAGKLNYAWYVSPRAPDQFWRGLPSGSGIPIHPTRQIYDNPDIEEFATPVSGAYPPWYDPSYWNEGLRPTFNLRNQMIAVIINLGFCWKLFLGFLVFGCLILASISRRGLLGLLNKLMLNWRVLLPSVIGLCSFILFTKVSGAKEPWGILQMRYIAPFIVVLFTSVFLSADLFNTRVTKNLLIALTLATVIVANINLAMQPRKLEFSTELSENIHWQVANEVGQLGIHAGDKVALIGTREFYWARLAKVKIVASLSLDFWSSDEMHKSAALKALKKLGVKAIIQPPPPVFLPYPTPTNDWHKLGSTSGYIYFF